MIVANTTKTNELTLFLCATAGESSTTIPPDSGAARTKSQGKVWIEFFYNFVFDHDKKKVTNIKGLWTTYKTQII